MRKLTLTLPYLPSDKLSPNWKPFVPKAIWVYKRERDKMASDVYGLAIAAMREIDIATLPAFGCIKITYTFLVPDHRHRDADNWVARMKSAQDALVKAGVVNRDTHEHVILGEPQFDVQKGQRRTIIEIKEMEAKDGN